MEKCPVCGNQYGLGHGHPRRESRHHIFPSVMYPGSQTVVHVCQKCHDEFNKLYPYRGQKWTRDECLENWKDFCTLKGKDILVIYPHLDKYF